MAVTVKVTIVDGKGKAHELPTQRIADSKKQGRYSLTANSLGVTGTVYIPLEPPKPKEVKAENDSIKALQEQIASLGKAIEAIAKSSK